MEFRSYQPGDEEGIIDLLNLVFGEERDRNWWEWYYKANPAGEAIIRVAAAGNKVVGHRALVPYRVWNGREYCLACQATDAATHPDFRGRGVFQKLTREVLTEAKAREWAFVFSFPNQHSLPLNRRLGWVPVQKLRKWIKPLFRFPRLGPGAGGRPALKRCREVGEEFTAFWERYGPLGRAGLRKDGPYLKWRYLGNPNRDYYLLTWEDGSELRAYVVLRLEGGRGHLLEFMPGAGDPVGLLGRVEDYLAAKGIRYLTMWPPPELPMPPWRLGYLPNLRRTGVFALRPLAGEPATAWRVTPGDTDYA